MAASITTTFSIIGYPLILHTDNGKEFTGKEIIAEIRKLSRHMTTLTGRPRTPRDQGSVERVNRVVKGILAAFERQQMNDGKKPNWTEGIPTLNISINIKENYGAGGVSSYQAVFNQQYEESEQALPGDLRSCQTARERVSLMSGSKFEEMLTANNWEHELEPVQEEDLDGNGYWSESSSVVDYEGEELSDEEPIDDQDT